MSSAAALGIDHDVLLDIVGQVFSGLFGEERGLPYPDRSAESRTSGSTVAIRGEWSGAVTVTCSEQLSRLAASELFQTSLDRLTEDDLRDVVGELANVIGGNVKSVLPTPSELSLPTPAGEDQPPTPHDVVLDLVWLREPLRIVVSTN